MVAVAAASEVVLVADALEVVIHVLVDALDAVGTELEVLAVVLPVIFRVQVIALEVVLQHAINHALQIVIQLVLEDVVHRVVIHAKKVVEMYAVDVLVHAVQDAKTCVLHA